ncbi:hypothetical protein SRHO_G00342770 [Serrasalmus rhombeus]
MELTGLEELLLSSNSLKGRISAFYRLLSSTSVSSYNALRTLWERDLTVSFSDDEWCRV